MIIYEVNLSVNEDVADRFKTWLEKHIVEILEISGFEKATIYDIESDEQGQVRWSVHYVLDTRESLENYFTHHAAAMREDGMKHFGGQFTADRRILSVNKQF